MYIYSKMEIWKSIDGYENYSVSSFGSVRNDKTDRMLKYYDNGHGYSIVSLCKNGKSNKYQVHVLVANTFIDNPKNGSCVDHIDNNRSNNNVANLRFATKTENAQNSKLSSKNKSGIKGVSFKKSSNKWRAYISIDGVKVHLGYFDNIEDAKKARVDSANQAFGQFINVCEK